MIGLKLNKQTTNEGGQAGIDCGNLWQQFEQEKYFDRIPDKIGNDICAVYFDYEGDHTKPYSYFIGCRVPADTVVPEGMDSLDIPAQTYTQLLAKGKMPDCIANCWREIWASDMNRAYGYDFEVYDERCRDWNNAEVDVFVTVP